MAPEHWLNCGFHWEKAPINDFFWIYRDKDVQKIITMHRGVLHW